MPDTSPEREGTKDRHLVDLPPEGKYGLVGREEDIMTLERAFQESPAVLLTGPAGVGKSELACGFARHLAGRGERLGGVLFTSFEYGAGLCRVLHELGTTLRGVSFARLSLVQQREWITDYLRRNPCLLIWDNFENAVHHLDDVEVRELLDFLGEIAGDGFSYILVTGRSADWPGRNGEIEWNHQKVAGLADPDARQLAGQILEGVGVEADTLDHGYQELLEILHGNPMAMRLLLPHLKEHTASELAQELGHLSPGELAESEIMNTALARSFLWLSPRTRIHLPFLAFLRQRVLLDVLTFITQEEVYSSVMGEEMGWGACRTLLREAQNAGILDSVSPSVYLIPSRVTSFLEQQLNDGLTPSQVSTLEDEFIRVYADLGDYFLDNLSSQSSESTVTGVLAEEASLLLVLHLAETRARWESAQLVLQPLGQVYKMQDRVPELRRLRRRLLSHIGGDPEQAERHGAVELWMYLQATEISDAIDRKELDAAEAICRTAMGYLESSARSDLQPQMASMNHYLGLIAQGRDQYEEAEGWYQKALAINEHLTENEAECADIYHQLGLITYSLQRYEEAEGWHQKALEIRRRIEDEAEVAHECHRLALVAEGRHQLDDALEWYHRARTAYERVGDKASSAALYYRLGLIAQAQYQYEDAIEWYQRGLLVYEELEDETGGAGELYQLGVIAIQRHEYQEAEEWLKQALGAYERLADEIGMANAHHHLGVVAHAQQRYQEAEGLYHTALEIFGRLEAGEVAAAITWGQLGLLADQHGNYPHAVWYVAHTYETATAHKLPLLSQVLIHLSSLRSKMGTPAFIRCWEEVSDSDILSELE